MKRNVQIAITPMATSGQWRVELVTNGRVFALFYGKVERQNDSIFLNGTLDIDPSVLLSGV